MPGGLATAKCRPRRSFPPSGHVRQCPAFRSVPHCSAIRNQQVTGSSPVIGSRFFNELAPPGRAARVFCHRVCHPKGELPDGEVREQTAERTGCGSTAQHRSQRKA